MRGRRTHAGRSRASRPGLRAVGLPPTPACGHDGGPSQRLDQAPRGDDGPDPFEQQEPPLAPDGRVDGEHRRPDQVEDEVHACVLRDDAGLSERERREHEQRADNLDEGTHVDLPVRRPFRLRPRSPGRSGCPPHLNVSAMRACSVVHGRRTVGAFAPPAPGSGLPGEAAVVRVRRRPRQPWPRRCAERPEGAAGLGSSGGRMGDACVLGELRARVHRGPRPSARPASGNCSSPLACDETLAFDTAGAAQVHGADRPSARRRSSKCTVPLVPRRGEVAGRSEGSRRVPRSRSVRASLARAAGAGGAGQETSRVGQDERDREQR